VRIEALGLAALALLTAASAAGAPCLETGRVLAQARPGHVGPDKPYEERLSFRLSAPDRVWAEASGLSGLGPEDRDAAPEVFLDDRYLGPLLSDFGEEWRSAQALRLGPGTHQLLLRCAEEGEGPLLSWKSLRVLGDAPCRPGPVPAVKPAAPAVQAPSCDALIRRRDWPARLRGDPLVLPAAPGRVALSGPLVHLRLGESWGLFMKIPTGPDGGPLPLVVRFDTPVPGRVRFSVRVDTQFHGGVVAAVGYAPNRWQWMTLSLCPGALRLRFAGEPPLKYAWGLPGLDFEMAARGVTLSLAPDSSSN
jgi:hypothetical protein